VSGPRRGRALVAVVTVASALALTRPAGAGDAVAQVGPGSVVRWPGEGIESCAVGERTWPPLDGVCFYAIDLLHGEGTVELARARDGQRESVAIRVGAYPYPVQKLTLPEGQVNLSAEDLARVRRESREIARLWGHTGDRRFTLPLQPPLDPLPGAQRLPRSR
jgi:hypothetical protein